jgi:hypothetical protein
VQPAYVCRQIDLPLAAFAASVARVATPALVLQLPAWWMLDALDAQSPWLAIAAAVPLWSALAGLLLLLGFSREERVVLVGALRRWAGALRPAGSSGH